MPAKVGQQCKDQSFFVIDQFAVGNYVLQSLASEEVQTLHQEKVVRSAAGA